MTTPKLLEAELDQLDAAELRHNMQQYFASPDFQTVCDRIGATLLPSTHPRDSHVIYLKLQNEVNNRTMSDLMQAIYTAAGPNSPKLVLSINPHLAALNADIDNQRPQTINASMQPHFLNFATQNGELVASVAVYAPRTSARDTQVMDVVVPPLESR